MANLNSIYDARIEQYKNELKFFSLDSRQVYFGDIPKRWDITDTLVSADISITSHGGVVVSFDSFIPEFPLGIERVHFDVLVSSSDILVSGNTIAPSISYSRRLSDEHGGFFVESDTVYVIPTAGLSSAYSGKTVHVLMANVDIDPSSSVYVYWRPRWFATDVLDSVGDFYGMSINIPKSIVANTGLQTVSNQIIDITPPVGTSWGDNCLVEVYIGSTYRNSYQNKSGFRYSYDSSMNHFSRGGDEFPPSGYARGAMPSSSQVEGVYLITNPMMITSPAIIKWRFDWGVGITSWFSKIHFPQENYTQLTAAYRPQRQIVIPKNTHAFDFNIQVIVGSSPDLSDYFTGGDISLNEPDTGSGYLHDYSDSGNSSHSANFHIIDVNYEIVNPGVDGFSYDQDNIITYRCPSTLLSDSEMYVLWRVRQATWSSSSCSSSSSSCSSSSCSSSSSSCSSSSCSSSSSSCSSSSCSSSSCSSSSSSSSSSSNSSSSSSSSDGGVSHVDGNYYCITYNLYDDETCTTFNSQITDCAQYIAAFDWFNDSLDTKINADGSCTSTFPISTQLVSVNSSHGVDGSCGGGC